MNVSLLLLMYHQISLVVVPEARHVPRPLIVFSLRELWSTQELARCDVVQHDRSGFRVSSDDVKGECRIRAESCLPSQLIVFSIFHQLPEYTLTSFESSRGGLLVTCTGVSVRSIARIWSVEDQRSCRAKEVWPQVTTSREQYFTEGDTISHIEGIARRGASSRTRICACYAFDVD